MGLFDKIKEPVILKEGNSAQEQLNALEALLADVEDAKLKAAIEREMTAVKAGIVGENTILFELKNSHIPMLVLHDLYLEFEGLNAQIDFLILTRRRQFVVECKNLYGNITVNNVGDFIREMGKRKEGIYSPVTQSKRHLELIKQMRSAERGNILTKSIFERNFYSNYRSVVVLANSKTILNAKYAPKEVKNNVIRADHLIEYIHKVNNEPDSVDGSEKDMIELGQYYLSKHQPCKTDYLEKYRTKMQQEQEKEDGQAAEETPQQPSSNETVNKTRDDVSVPLCPRCGAPMVKRVAGRGENSGNPFWGCSNYPKCHAIINILSASSLSMGQ